MEHFHGLGVDVILMDPAYVCGRDHILSAAMHAERAFAQGTNRSKTILTETILYAAGERQISKALAKMRPKEECKEIVTVVFGNDDLKLNEIDAVSDDSIFSPSGEKAKNLGITVIDNVSAEDLVLEMVAMMDSQKQ
jgi:KEOPS complex subunit Cgi121